MIPGGLLRGGGVLPVPGAAAALAVALSACGSAAAAGTPAAPSGPSAPLTVLAAASLGDAFTAAQPALERSHRGLQLTFSFAGSQTLVANLEAGAPADVVATADQASMSALVSAGLVEEPHVFVRNRLEIAVAPGNPHSIRGLAGLARAGVSVVLADPSVPAGKYARQALARAGVAVTPKSNEVSVEAALEKVESGDADAAIVYTTDVRAAAGRVTGVIIPDGENVVATYPIAVVITSAHPAAAAALVDDAVSGTLQHDLRVRGFLAP